MKHRNLLALTTLALPLAWAFLPPADRVAFGVSEGTTLSKTFTSRQELSLDDMSVVMNGQEMDTAMMGSIEMNMTANTEITVIDRYVTVSDERPLKVRRTFDQLENQMDMEATGNPMLDEMSVSGSSDLEGLAVVFTWDEAGDYDVAFEEEGRDEELLNGLLQEMDFLAFLPDGEVSEGEQWEIEPRALLHVLAPGGNLKFTPEGEELADMMQMGNQMNVAETLGDFEGTFTGTFTGTREVDGTKVAVIQIDVDASSSKDMTDIVSQAMEEMEMPPEMGEVEMEYDSVDTEFEFKGKGELLWNIAGGHAHSFDLSGDALIATDMSYSMKMGEQSMDMEMSMEMSGTQTVTARFQPAP